MNLNRLFSITKADLVISILSFVLIFVTVIISRTGRLESQDSFVFNENTEIIFKDKSDLEDLIIELQKNSVAVDKEELAWASRIFGWRSFQRGRYVFKGNYSYNTMLSKLSRGNQDPVSVVILPGITEDRFINEVSAKLHFTSQDLSAMLSDSVFLAKNNLNEEELFGRMLPETYLIYWTANPADVRKKILNEFDHLVSNKFSERAKEQEITLNEALTMASIIEWEATNAKEKPIISGLYWNRLDKGMLLQADPTVSFAVGERRRLLFEDYELDHPFNTYVNKGLPPAPITNPSVGSIEAALYPQDHEYLYMVASPDGGHVFTRTFEEHTRESEKWRKWLRQQYKIKQQKEAEEEVQKETR